MNLTIHGATELLNGEVLPATLWAQLHLANPTDAGTSNIAVEDRRMSFTRTTAVSAACTNAANLLWDVIPANETISHISLWDDETVGNCWMVGALVAPAAGAIGEGLLIQSGELDLSMVTWA